MNYVFNIGNTVSIKKNSQGLNFVDGEIYWPEGYDQCIESTGTIVLAVYGYSWQDTSYAYYSTVGPRSEYDPLSFYGVVLPGNPIVYMLTPESLIPSASEMYSNRRSKKVDESVVPPEFGWSPEDEGD